MHWKIARDPYLSALCLKQGEQAVYDAGFFLDDDPEDARLDDVDWLCTPRPKLAVTGARPAVLLSTGGFCPLHSGHLEMMELARGAALTAGFDVIGGYLSPGHDGYLRMKCGPSMPSTSQRLAQVAAAIANSPWLSLDPWEAVHRRVAVNFTDVVARLSAYLQKHVDPRIVVLFVCGGDNARFAHAFRERGHCVVVGRPGAEAELARWRTQLGQHPRLLWAEGKNTSASRTLRADWLPAREPARPRIVLRLEDERAVRTLGIPGLRSFQDELVTILREHAEVRCLPLSTPADAPDVINLDPMFVAQHELALSRLFAVGGYEALGFVARPGTPPLEQQLAAIPPGEYSLRDDDRVTGATLEAVRAMLPASVHIRATELAIEHGPDEDVIDARDFLLGADEGGLVLALPDGGIGRAPYLLPYVDPAVRASIADCHAFSLRIWALNERTFAGTALRVSNLPAASRHLFSAHGDVTLESLCAWHVARLQELALHGMLLKRSEP